MSEISIPSRPGPHIVLRVIYFLCVGWWLGFLSSFIAWLLNITIVGLPVGIWIINRLPQIITLRAPETGSLLQIVDGVVIISEKPPVAQRSFIGRAVFFVLIGWWFSALWMMVAYLCLITIIGIPLSFWMYGRVAAVTTLQRM